MAEPRTPSPDGLDSACALLPVAGAPNATSGKRPFPGEPEPEHEPEPEPRSYVHADTFADFSADPTHLPQKMTQKHRRWQERHEQEMGDGAVQNASPADARAIKESAEAWAEFEWRNRAAPAAGGGVLEKQFIGQGVSLEELVAAEVGGHSQLRGRSRSDVKQKYEPIEISLMSGTTHCVI